MKSWIKGTQGAFQAHASEDSSAAIKKNWQSLEICEKEIKQMMDTIRAVARDIFIYVDHHERSKKKSHSPNYQDFYQTLKNLSESYNPYSILGYTLGIMGETGLNQYEILMSLLDDVKTCIIYPLESIISTYQSLHKLKLKLLKMYSELEAARNKLKHADKKTVGKDSNTLFTDNFYLTINFEEHQTSILQIYKNFLKQTKERTLKIAEFLECSLIYHQACLENVNQISNMIKSRVASDFRAPVFGVPLRDHLRHCRINVSVVIQDSVAWIVNHGIEEQGLFREQGNKLHVEKLIAAFDADIKIPTSFISSVHVICCAFKYYLRTLPESLLFYGWCIDDLNRLKTNQDEDIVGTVKKHITSLPREFHHNLNYMMNFLVKVVANQGKNLMTSKNLGVVFGPTLITPLLGADEQLLEYSTLSSKIVTTIIDNYHLMFPEECELKCNEYKRLVHEFGDRTTPGGIIPRTSSSAYPTEPIPSYIEEEQEPDCFTSPYYFTNKFAYEQLKIGQAQQLLADASTQEKIVPKT